MRLTTLSCGITALLSASSTLADSIQTPTASPTIDDYRAAITPFPELVEDAAHLDIRQNLGVQPDAEQNPGQVPPVTVYTIGTQIGATGVITQLTYTQTFSAVPDQWPSPKAGVIGMGNLHQKRAAEPMITGIVAIEQPVNMVKEVEVVVVPLQRVTEVLVMKTMVVSDMVMVKETAQAQSQAPAGSSTGGYRPLATGAAFLGIQPSGARSSLRA